MKDVAKMFKYDRKSGRLFWNIKRSGVTIGNEVASMYKGYKGAKVNGRLYLAHRVIWFIENGRLPLKGFEIDHIDHIKTNNKISNLREVTHAENQRNHPKYKNNSSGITGVSFHKRVKKWEAYIGRKTLGYFSDIEDAIKCRLDNEKELGYHENHGK